MAGLLAPSFTGVATGSSRSAWFRADLVAGLTVWAVLALHRDLDEAVASATGDGRPPAGGV